MTRPQRHARNLAANPISRPFRRVFPVIFLGLAATCTAVPTQSRSAQDHATVAGQRNKAQEESNRQLVIRFHDLAFNQHKVADAAELLAEDYIQHNPRIANGKAAFTANFAKAIANLPGLTSRLVRSAADGDLVWLHTHVRETVAAEDRGFAVMDIYRVVDGVIVEHWDVIQPVPETTANGNTMF